MAGETWAKPALVSWINRTFIVKGRCALGNRSPNSLPVQGPARLPFKLWLKEHTSPPKVISSTPQAETAQIQQNQPGHSGGLAGAGPISDGNPCRIPSVAQNSLGPKG